MQWNNKKHQDDKGNCSHKKVKKVQPSSVPSFTTISSPIFLRMATDRLTDKVQNDNLRTRIKILLCS